MCNECWKEFKGWCRSFTKTEIFLLILEAILLILCIVLLIFLIMHIIACHVGLSIDVTEKPPKTDTSAIGPPSGMSLVPSARPPDKGTSTLRPGHTTLNPRVTCTWEPSKKTASPTRYYLDGPTPTETSTKSTTTTRQIAVFINLDRTMPMPGEDTLQASTEPVELEGVDELVLDEESDGEEAPPEVGGAVLALVQAQRGTFGCVLTAISDRWTLTAASCIEAIEEVGSLDEYVMQEGGGGAGAGGGGPVGVADVQLHPLFSGRNRSYDVAALRAARPLRLAGPPLALPALADYFLITVGERFSLLGFGPFRTPEPTKASREVRSAAVYSLPGAACRAADDAADDDSAAGDGNDNDTWAPRPRHLSRHLSRGREEAHGAGGCGAAALCAGVRWARGAACSYCAGAPLVRAGALLGVMAEARGCGLTCEPALYVNVAAVRDWIDMLFNPE